MAKFGLQLLLTMLVACGGHKSSDTTPDPDRPSEGATGDIIPPEKMDEVDQNLKRRSTQVSHCLARAVADGEVTRGTKGRITFAIRVGTEGRASSVSVIKSEIEAQSVVDSPPHSLVGSAAHPGIAGVIDCATKLVKDTSFPTLPRAYDTSFTYGLDAS